MQVRVELGRVRQNHLGDSQAEQARSANCHADTAGTHDGVRILAVPGTDPTQDRPRRIHVVEMRTEYRLVLEVVRKELGGGLQARNQRRNTQGWDDLVGLGFRCAYLRTDGVVEFVFHLLRPFVLVEPGWVTVTASPTTTRFWRCADASSIGTPGISSPRFSKAGD